MDVTPQLLHDVEFREAKRGGYNTQDVDEFLERLAVGLERQESTVRDARQRIEDAEARAAEAERRAQQAEQAASQTSASDETLKRTLVLAQRTADAAIREAEEEASRTLSSAQAEASRLLAEAQEASARAEAEAEADAHKAHEEARTRVLAEMGELEALRDRLRDDVELLERHVADQRAHVQHAVQELQRMLDDPDSLAEVPVPEISDAVAPAALHSQREPLRAEPIEHDAPAGWSPDDEAWGEEPLDEVDGPPTQPVQVLDEEDADDDAYLTELRKAMTDDSPLGPRDDPGELFETSADTGRSRFGRRR